MSRLPSTTRIQLTVWGLAACFLAALAGGATALSWSVRTRSLGESEVQITRFTSGAEAAVNRALLGFDVLLTSTTELLQLASPTPSSTSSKAHSLDTAAVSNLLRSAARQNLMVRYVALLDGTGNVLASSDPAGAHRAVELPPGFLQTLTGQQMPTLTISAPSVSFASSERVLYVARRVLRSDGPSLYAVAQVPTAMLTTVLRQGVDIPGLEITLEQNDGTLLIGTPPLPAEQGAVFLAPTLDKLQTSDWTQPARLTRVHAFIGANRLMYPDLWISASLPLSAALQSSGTERHGILVAALLFAVLVVAAAALIQAYLLRLHAARELVANAKATLDQALAAMVSGFLLLDPQRNVVQWNPRFEEIFHWLKPVLTPGLSFRALIEATVHNHLPGATPAEKQAWVEQRLLQQSRTDEHEQKLSTGRVVQVIERPMPEGGYVIVYNDVTDLRRANAEIESLAFYDPLTGLPNRRLLLDRLDQATVQAARSGETGALLFLDLDNFKVLNDTRGHAVGDLLLQQMAQRLREVVRAGDTVARLGGDEFVVMLGELTGDPAEVTAQVQRIGEKILASLSQPYQLAEHAFRAGGCSVGITLFGKDSPNAPELLKQADIAMYQAKAGRGNTLCFFTPQMQVDIDARARLEGDLQTALAEGQFELHYQPQFTLEGRMVGAEALLRWRHPQWGLVSPADFIAIAESSGLIVPMGLWALRTACLQLAAWQDTPRFDALQLSVNVSARQFRQSDFVEQVIAVIDQTGARAHRLKLELTESLVLDDMQGSIAKMHQLRNKGVRFAMDDFGTGQSSLAYLTRLPLHQLKIDQSFVHNIGERHADDVIIQTIIGMARTLDLEIIAEGVETAAQRDFLARHGCGLYQGYFFSRPVRAGPLEALMT